MCCFFVLCRKTKCESYGSLKIEEWMFRFAEIVSGISVCTTKRNAHEQMKRERNTWTVRVGCREAPDVSFGFTDGPSAYGENVGESEKGGQVTKGVWGMSWR